jgi:hypothetical protein
MIIAARIIVKRKKAKRRREKALEIAQKRIAEVQDKEKRNWRY